MARLIGLMERLDLRVWDAHVLDEREPLMRYSPRAQIPLFSMDASDARLCNVPGPAGTLPEGVTWRIRAVGLGLNFSDGAMYTEVFRGMTLTLTYGNRDIYSFAAQQFLDRAIAHGLDPEPSLGFAWSQQLGRAVNYPSGAQYRVRLELSNHLRDRLRSAEEGILRGRDEYRHWFSEIRAYLLGLQTRSIDRVGEEQ